MESDICELPRYSPVGVGRQVLRGVEREMLLSNQVKWSARLLRVMKPMT